MPAFFYSEMLKSSALHPPIAALKKTVEISYNPSSI